MKCKPPLITLSFLAALPLGAIAAEPATQAPAGSPPAKEATSAPAAKTQTPPLFEQLDTNRDGYVTAEEAKRSADITARFKELDRNHDGKVSLAEFGKEATSPSPSGMSGPSGTSRDMPSSTPSPSGPRE